LSTTKALNGDIKCFDLVISTEYPYLAGEVNAVDMVGSPEHDSVSDKDYVFVDFQSDNYSESRIKEIEEHFSKLYGEPKTFKELCSDLSNFKMSPEKLITVSNEAELKPLLESGEKAAAYTLKKMLGEKYIFRQSKTVDEVKKILEMGEMETTGENIVPFGIRAGNLDIEVTIYFDKGLSPYLGYYCSAFENGFWESYGDLEDRVNLDVPDIEAEMFKILVKFSEACSLSFFDQTEIETKTLRTHDELMTKAEAAIKRGNADDKRTDDKWALFRGLEVAPLSQTMIDLLYEKDDVTEEMLEFAIEQSDGEYSAGEIDFTNKDEITSDYLEKIEHQMLSEKLYERAEKEMEQFIQDFKHDIISPDVVMSDESILTRAYKLTVRNEMLIYLEGAESLDTDDLKALLTLDNPLDYLYDSWQESDVNIKDSIIDVVDDAVNELARSVEDDERGYLDENEDEDDLEI